MVELQEDRGARRVAVLARPQTAAAPLAAHARSGPRDAGEASSSCCLVSA